MVVPCRRPLCETSTPGTFRLSYSFRSLLALCSHHRDEAANQPLGVRARFASADFEMRGVPPGPFAHLRYVDLLPPRASTSGVERRPREHFKVDVEKPRLFRFVHRRRRGSLWSSVQSQLFTTDYVLPLSPRERAAQGATRSGYI